MSDGGSAFPNSSTADGHANNVPQGMTLRDYFAAAALQGLLPKLPLVDQCGEHGPAVADKIAHNRDIAESCYWLADAMLAARSPSPEPTP